MKLKTAKNELMQKVGRNLLKFQLLEKVLKWLVINGDISGYASEFKQNQEKRQNSVGSHTLGMVAGQFFEQSFSGKDNDASFPEALKEPFFKITFRIEEESQDTEARKESLSNLVSARNDLVHHFLDRIDLSSKPSLFDACDYLDKQLESITTELDYYRNLGISHQKLRKSGSAFFMSEEGRDFFMGKNNT